MQKSFYFLGIILLLVSFGSCSKDQESIDAEIIQSYIVEHNLTAIEGQDGLYYTIDSIGTGISPTLNHNVTVHYKGFYTDGTQFDGTTTSPATFPLANLIKGWKYGLPNYKEGGGGKLLIPSHLGYGSNPPAGVRANAVLIFDIALISVQ